MKNLWVIAPADYEYPEVWQRVWELNLKKGFISIGWPGQLRMWDCERQPFCPFRCEIPLGLRHASVGPTAVQLKGPKKDHAKRVAPRACSMSFGEIGINFIHVHHLMPGCIARRKKYRVNATKDLVPVCPNCHAMLHTSSLPLAVRQLRRIISEREFHSSRLT